MRHTEAGASNKRVVLPCFPDAHAFLLSITPPPTGLMADLIPLAQAQSRLLALRGPLTVEPTPLIEAAGRWAAMEVTARRTQPAADLSAMDGYAIRFADMPGPWRIVGESAAGSATVPPVGIGETVRIFTGAPLPPGADTVVIQEDVRREAGTDGSDDRVLLTGDGPPHHGAHVRKAGSDFRTGDLLIPAGSAIGPAQIALAATGGHGVLPVRRRPRIALISTGDELVPAGTTAEGVQLPSSNAPMLHAMLAAGGGADVTDHGIVPDDLDATVAAFRRAQDADIIVTTGGASVGDRDLVRPALEVAGARIDFWRIALKPGKPLMAGRLGNAIVIGLPGNPVSAFVTARLFLLPLVRHLGGAEEPFARPRAMRLAGPLPATGRRMEFLRGRRVGARVRPLGTQDSAALGALSAADLLIVRPPFSPSLPSGGTVTVLPIA